MRLTCSAPYCYTLCYKVKFLTKSIPLLLFFCLFVSLFCFVLVLLIREEIQVQNFSYSVLQKLIRKLELNERHFPFLN